MRHNAARSIVKSCITLVEQFPVGNPEVYLIYYFHFVHNLVIKCENNLEYLRTTFQ